MKTARGTNFDLDDLMQKLSEEPEKHAEGAARMQVRQGGKVSTDDLMKGLAQRTESIVSRHEAQRKKEADAQAARRRQHPDQFERWQRDHGKEGY